MAVPWSARVLQQGFARGQPVHSSPHHNHMTVLWISRRLMCCLIRQNGESNSTRGQDGNRGIFGCGNPTVEPPSAPFLRRGSL